METISGIYGIYCKPTKKWYIGSTYSIKKRWKEHHKCLRGGHHPNIYLQRAWNKYHKKQFKFKILETCDEENLLKLEETYIEKFESYNMEKGFNLQRYPTRFNFGYKFSIEGLKNLSDAHLGLSANNKEKIKATIKKKKHGCKRCILKSPNGEIVHVHGMLAFCKENGLFIINLKKVLTGEFKQYKGWTLAQPVIERGKKKNVAKELTLINMEGQTIHYKGIRNFCEAYNLDRGAICRVLNGKSRSHKGWRLPCPA